MASMDVPPALGALMEAAGLAPAYQDAFGRARTVPASGARAILAALGLPAGDEAECDWSLRRLAEAPWRRGVAAAVIVAAEQQPGAVLLHGPAGAAIAWTLRLENGEVRTGVWRLNGEGPRHSLEGQALIRQRAALPTDLPEGYHQLAVELPGGVARSMVIVAPPRCWTPEEAAPGRRLWGVTAQLYALRGPGDGGHGRYSDLERLILRAAGEGGDFVGLNPLHALYTADPGRFSPYDPASRVFFNILPIDHGRPLPPPATEDVDYPAYAARHRVALEAAFAAWRDAPTDEDRFARFVEERGPALERFAVFMAIQERLAAQNPAMRDWRRWPGGLGDAENPETAAFARENTAAIAFHKWAQWMADRQLAAVQARARGAGMAIGLYADLAVGVAASSADCWANPALFAQGVSVGAPPDLLNHLGQDWGLAPFNPLALAEQGYQPWIAVLRANMARAGAIRIDHVMALNRLFLTPEGGGAAQGGYLAYPFKALTRILALESRRHRCVVIGEDLGTVPEGFREAMAEASVQSYRVLQFERVGDGLFARPEAWPSAALAVFGTHDLAPAAGFWEGRDLAARRALGLYPSPEVAAAEEAARSKDRRRLIDALIDAGLWPADPPTDAETLPMSPALMRAIHRYIARTPSRLMAVQTEDLASETRMTNLPGTVDEHPNWRRRLPQDVDSLFEAPETRAVLAAVREERGRDKRSE